ncbi:MAG: 1-deoxy-D-xylulose-5-phosphate reductoisomerase [Ruminococcaceae bacterium]|nr:1-deoxy-D-xylulose-5-phosphate reductoisomerase [Oscillospiraceae bacterium]
MTNHVSILGSTGSIGTQALDVVRKRGINVTALCVHNNVELLEKQAREFAPQLVAVFDKNRFNDLKARLADTPIRVEAGMDGLCACATESQCDTVLTSVVGMVGLVPTLCAIEAGKNIALANKETLVAGGELVMAAAKRKGVKILPVDSEHSAIFQCLESSPRKEALKRIILTASGGPFFGKTLEALKSVTKAQALNHPNWSMGQKVTIDSSTMMNKGLEFIEAKWLFDLTPEQIDIVVHRESIVHSMIEFQDNSIIAQMGVPDMRIPIQYALTYPERYESPVEQLSFAQYPKLTFFEPDYKTFLCIDICRDAIRRAGVFPAAANGANEAAVQLFLDDKIAYYDIPFAVREAMENAPQKSSVTLEDIFEADRAAREFVLEKHA